MFTREEGARTKGEGGAGGKGAGAKGSESSHITFCWRPQPSVELRVLPAGGAWHTFLCRFPVVAAGLPTCQRKGSIAGLS